MNRDLEQLRLLSIFHYVLAGVMVFFTCMTVGYMGLMGVVMPEMMDNMEAQVNEVAEKAEAEEANRRAAEARRQGKPIVPRQDREDALRQPFQPVEFPKELTMLFGVMMGMQVLIFGVLAISCGVAGRKLSTHSSYTFCLVVAGLECLWMPLGTVLGVFTIIVLIRPSVKAIFGVLGDDVELTVEEDEFE